jgi:D-xylose transport system substrate-binding protein
MKYHVTRALALPGAALVALSLLAACSSSGSSSSAPAGEASAAGAKIGLLLPDSVTPRYENDDKPFFTAKIKSLCPDCTVLYADASGDAAKQQQQAESMLTEGAKVLVLDPFDGAAAQSIVTEAAAKKVPVVSYDALVNGGKSAYYVTFDNNKVGELQGTALVDKLKADDVPAGSGILMINGSPTDNTSAQFRDGALSVIKTSPYKVLASFDTPGWSPANAQTWVDGQITRFGAGQIKGVLAANDGLGGGAIAAFQSAGVHNVPPTTGQDASLAGIQNILIGTQYMTVYKAFKPEAETAAEVAIDLLHGQAFPTHDTTDGVPSVFLTPVPVTVKQIEPTVMKDNLYTVAQVCTADFQAACATAGIQ